MKLHTRRMFWALGLLLGASLLCFSSLAAGAATLGSIFGVLYDDAENPLSFTFTAGVCQFRSSLSNNFPRTAPRFENFIPAGRSGWAKFYSLSDIGLLGAQLNFNPNAGTAANAFNQEIGRASC